MKGFKQVLVAIFEEIGCDNFDQVTTLLDFVIKFQNLQSKSCLKAINALVRDVGKEITEDALNNPIMTYETDFEFIKADIEQFRGQKIRPECLSTVHPWNYRLDAIDMKYIMNNDLTPQICEDLRSRNAQVFWLSNFKT